MLSRKRCIQHPLILEDSMPIQRTGRKVKLFFLVLTLVLISIAVAGIAVADEFLMLV